MRNELIDDIWRHIEPSVNGYSQVIQLCLAEMTVEQLEAILDRLSESYPMSREQFKAAVDKISRVLREAGKHLGDSEYADFVFDALHAVEHQEAGRTNAA
jgi:hypothetical protein